MPATWTISAKLVGFLASLLAESDYASALSSYYPSIMWAGPGWLEGPNHEPTPTPPKYMVGLVDKKDVRHFKIVLPNTKFGFIVFSPKPEDAQSSHRLIDFDGKNIVVR